MKYEHRMIIKDHKNNLNRELSLVEQKRMQWAKEREEMARMEEYHSRIASRYEKNLLRSQVSQVIAQNDVFEPNNYHHKNFNIRRVRSPNLPPIEKTMLRSQGSNNSDHSSGYLSSSGGNGTMPISGAIDSSNYMDYKYASNGRVESLDIKLPLNNIQPLKKHSLASSLNDFSNNEAELDGPNRSQLHSPTSETSSMASHDMGSDSSFPNSCHVETSSNFQQRNGRAKWGSYIFDSFSKENMRSPRNTNGPGWLEKSLSEVRPESDDDMMSVSTHSVSSYLRGQNVPVDPQILAEREAKRRAAMELQQAIKQQLYDRENQKKMEREKCLQFERMEEEKIARQVEKERQRVEYEQKKQFEKFEAERKKEEAMRKALEKAANEAQREKERRRKEKLSMQVAIDETISVQKIGERTEISIVAPEKQQAKETHQVQDKADVKIVVNEPPSPAHCHTCTEANDGDAEDDGETILIGTPIKLKKKNLDTYRKKFNKRQMKADENSVTASEEENSSPVKTPPKRAETPQKRSETPPLPEKPEKQMKNFSDIDNLALLLQSLPLLPIVPVPPDFFGFNSQMNNLALLMNAQNRLNSPNSVSIFTNANNSEKQLDICQFLKPPSSPQTITLQIQQAPLEMKTTTDEDYGVKIQSPPSTPTLGEKRSPVRSETFDKAESDASSGSKMSNKSTVPPSPLPHEGTFLINKDDEEKPESVKSQTHDACTSMTAGELKVPQEEEKEVKFLTPQKYRTEFKFSDSLQTTGTQTESFLFCEYCSFQHQKHQQHHNCQAQSQADDTDSNLDSLREDRKSGKSSLECRPKWGVRNPPVKYLKASERDPWHGKNRRRRQLKKTMSCDIDTRIEDPSTCILRDCPLGKSTTTTTSSSSQSKLQQQHSINRENVCRDLVPIKYDRFGRICVLDEAKFTLNNGTFRRIGASKSDTTYATTSDAESSIIDLKHRVFFPREREFRDLFVD